MGKSADVSKLETLRCNKCGMEPSYATTILDPPTMSAREVRIALEARPKENPPA